MNILSVWAFSLVPTIITWADDASKTPELVWVVNFILFFMLWATEIAMLWSGKWTNKFTVAIIKLVEENQISNDPTRSSDDFSVFQKNVAAQTVDNITDTSTSKNRACCRSRQSRDSPPFSQLVSFQIVCQVIQDLSLIHISEPTRPY